MRSVTNRTTVYLDYAASAPAREESLVAERAYEDSPIAGANPNSLHTLGREAARALDGARRDIVRCVGGGFRPSDVVFTSGGTESNNLALLGLSRGAHQRDRKRTRVVLSAIEHDSELDVTGVLRDRGFDVTLVKPGRDGVVTRDALENVLGPDCALISIMSANNETGVVQPVSELAAAAHAAGRYPGRPLRSPHPPDRSQRNGSSHTSFRSQPFSKKGPAGKHRRADGLPHIRRHYIKPVRMLRCIIGKLNMAAVQIIAEFGELRQRKCAVPAVRSLQQIPEKRDLLFRPSLHHLAAAALRVQTILRPDFLQRAVHLNGCSLEIPANLAHIRTNLDPLCLLRKFLPAGSLMCPSRGKEEAASCDGKSSRNH